MAIEISNKEFRKIISCSSNIVSNNNGGNMKNKLTDLNNHLFE